MAGSTALRPASSSSSSNFISSSSSPSYSRLLLLLTLLSLSLATFAFVLQWRTGLPYPIDNGPDGIDPHGFPGMASSRPVKLSSSSVGCADILGQSSKLSFPYYRDWSFSWGPGSVSDNGPQGKAASSGVSKVLESIPGVKVTHRTKELEEQQAKSRIWNESWLANFFYKPCNSELFVKQSLNMEMAIVMAREAGIDWIMHLDTDELLHPAGTHHYSVQELLSELPQDVDMVVFPNYESCVERDDIKEPFSEVSMFKRNYDHLSKDTYFANYKLATRDNPNYFLTYGNGKSAARIQDNLRSNGAHRWHNYKKEPKEMSSEEAAVLHYTYPKFSDLTSRRDRCRCKPTKEDVKRCFMLDFDRDAFIMASTASEEELLEWYRKHVVWTETEVKTKLLQLGILERIYAPMAIVQGLREAGIFTNVIASGWQKQSKDDKLLSFTKMGSNFSRNAGLQEVSSRKLGYMGTQTTARKTMEFAENASYAAVPPQSPPQI